MKKIRMKNKLVEIDGDEMTRILWTNIKEILIEPYVNLQSEYYDLGLENREHTKDQITKDAAYAIKKLGVGVKCATITPNAQRVEEYNLSQMWKSPNGTIRAILDGTVFRTPITLDGISPMVKCWDKPITIARHAYGDVYSGTEAIVPAGGRVELLLPDGSKKLVHEFSESGIVQAVHNTDASISSFARSCFNYALSVKQDLWFGSKDTISKIYDHRFKDIFASIFESEFLRQFKMCGINYYYMLIDDAVARVMKSNGGFVWACKNYDGDVMSDMLASAFGSLAMMTSVLVSPDGQFEFEAAHGTVTRHYYKHINGQSTSTNPVATIFAWTGALNKRGELDHTVELCYFAKALERATLSVIESGIMTNDLTSIFSKDNVTARGVGTFEFLRAVASEIDSHILK
ncbi:MAG: NADP-dependent isocitrate dehydrogenase [Christensenellaceae bacterium]|jgi:isocitrate dehydrogenase|nr:NADP-dependent isocitrate dehydrogenase [Christensenellaceae bacterium]